MPFLHKPLRFNICYGTYDKPNFCVKLFRRVRDGFFPIRMDILFRVVLSCFQLNHPHAHNALWRATKLLCPVVPSRTRRLLPHPHGYLV